MALTSFMFLVMFFVFLPFNALAYYTAIPVHHHRLASHNYRDALSKSILFFEGLSWRRDSGLSDGSLPTVLRRRSNVKFGFPMVFTTTMLSWSVMEFGGLMKGELPNAKAAIRWATDYLLKATAQHDTIYFQVFQFADKYKGDYSDSLKRAVCPLYCSYSVYQDELLWGATWLHKAPRNPTYLSYIQANGQVLGAAEFDNTFGWDNKHAGARILLSKALFFQSKEKAKGPGPVQDDRGSLSFPLPFLHGKRRRFVHAPWDETMFGLPLSNWARFIIGLFVVRFLISAHFSRLKNPLIVFYDWN